MRVLLDMTHTLLIVVVPTIRRFMDMDDSIFLPDNKIYRLVVFDNHSPFTLWTSSGMIVIECLFYS